MHTVEDLMQLIPQKPTEKSGRGRKSLLSETRKSSLAKALQTCIAHGEKVPHQQLMEHFQLSRATYYRYVNEFRENGLLDKSSKSERIEASKVRAMLQAEQWERTRPIQFDLARLTSYTPNKTFLISAKIRKELERCTEAAHTVSPRDLTQRIWHSMVRDLAFSSSVLEGVRMLNPLDVQRIQEFIQSGQGELPEGLSTSDVLITSNHCDAIEYLLKIPQEGRRLQTEDIYCLHRALMQGLLPENQVGTMREHNVRITSSRYQPLDKTNKTSLPSLLNMTISKASQILDPHEKCLFLLANLSYLQAFTDGNKRTARLASTVALLEEGVCPVVTFHESEEEYRQALLAYYETGKTDLLAQNYLKNYKSSLNHYKSLLLEVNMTPQSHIEFFTRTKGFTQNVIREIALNGKPLEVAFRQCQQSMNFAFHDEQSQTPGAIRASDVVRLIKKLLLTLERNHAQLQLSYKEIEPFLKRLEEEGPFYLRQQNLAQPASSAHALNEHPKPGNQNTTTETREVSGLDTVIQLPVLSPSVSPLMSADHRGSDQEISSPLVPIVAKRNSTGSLFNEDLSASLLTGHFSDSVYAYPDVCYDEDVITKVCRAIAGQSPPAPIVHLTKDSNDDEDSESNSSHFRA